LVGIVVSILTTEEWCTQLLDVVDLMVVLTFSAMFMFWSHGLHWPSGGGQPKLGH